jgi:hypothetical protein
VTADTPATVLCDGDAGLWRLQRAALPKVLLHPWCCWSRPVEAVA